MDGIMTSKLFTTRQGTVFLGVIAAVIAAVALIVYLHQYRNSVNNNAASSSVLVAKGLIQKGTPGNVIGSNDLSRPRKVSESTLDTPAFTGAFVNPGELAGKVAVKDIFPGQPLTADDFGPATNSLTQQLSPQERAVVIPLGSPQQVGGQIGAGSHVDVWWTPTASGDAKAATVLLFQDVYVLATNGGNVTLRTTPRQAGQVIFASQTGQVWFALRPTIAKNLANQAPISRARG